MFEVGNTMKRGARELARWPPGNLLRKVPKPARKGPWGRY